MVDKVKQITTLALPALVMIILIPFIENDYVLTIIYIAVIVVMLLIKHDTWDILAAVFGIIVITFFEYIFVKTGVETFNRNSLFGIMPLWLPFLWSYGIIGIKRGLIILGRK